MAPSRLPAVLLLVAFLVPTALLVPTAHAQMLDDIADDRVPLSEPQRNVAGKQALVTVSGETLRGPISGLAVEAWSADPDLTAEARFLTAGSWSSWLPMRIVRSAVGDGLVAGYRGSETDGATQFQIRFITDPATALIVREAGTFRPSLEEADLPSPGLAPIAARSQGDIIPPALITREEWGAEPFIRGDPVPLARPDYNYMTFHHAAGFSGTTREEGIAQVKAIQDLHQDVRGWSDIGYHFVIDRGGHLYQGRPFMNDASSLEDLPVFAQGAHVGGANTGNIGICLLGCYHPPEGGHCREEITPEALETYVTLFAFLSERYGVAPSQIRGHRDFSSTACPGDSNYALLPQIRSDVSTLLVTGNQPIAQALMTAEVLADGVVQVSWTFLADFGVVSFRLERWTGDERSAVLVEGSGATSAGFADSGVLSGEPVSYRLYVTDAAGREQRVAVAEVAADLPVRHALSQVYPNPAAGDVRFRYYLPTQGNVRLELFDVVGRSVAVLAEGRQEGEQWYSVPLAASSLPAGVYYYRLTVEGFGGTVFDESKTLVLAP